MKNSQKVKICQYLLSCVDDEYRDGLNGLVDIEMLRNAFEAETQTNLPYTLEEKAENWLRGLCSAVSIDFYPHDIAPLLENFNLPNDDAYWNKCAQCLIDLLYNYEPEFKEGDKVTFRPYEKSYKCQVVKVTRTEKDKVYYSLRGEAVSQTTGACILESKLYESVENV